MEVTLILIYFVNPKYYQNEKMKIGQILVCCMTNVSMFLGQCRRLETSPSPPNCSKDFRKVRKVLSLLLCIK